MAITIQELKGDQLSEFLDATSILHILTRILPPNTRSYLSKILWSTIYWQLCLIVIFILIFFFSHKHFRVGGLLFPFPLIDLDSSHFQFVASNIVLV